MGKYVIALDAGTTSNRAIIFNKEREIVAVSSKRVYTNLSKTRMG